MDIFKGNYKRATGKNLFINCILLIKLINQAISHFENVCKGQRKGLLVGMKIRRLVLPMLHYIKDQVFVSICGGY